MRSRPLWPNLPAVPPSLPVCPPAPSISFSPRPPKVSGEGRRESESEGQSGETEERGERGGDARCALFGCAVRTRWCSLDTCLPRAPTAPRALWVLFGGPHKGLWLDTLTPAACLTGGLAEVPPSSLPTLSLCFVFF